MSRIDRAFIAGLSLVFLGASVLLWPVDALGWWGCWALAAILAALAYFVSAGTQVAFVLWRAILALLPVGGLALVIVWGLLAQEWLDGDLLRALIAGIVVAAGWLAGFVTQELRRLDGRNEQRDDLIRALVVEIAFAIRRCEAVDWEDQKTKAQERFFKDRRYVPFVHLKVQNSGLQKVIENVALLSSWQIDPIVAYGHLVSEILELTATLKTEEYRALDAQRREQVFLFWLDLQSRVAQQGNIALAALEKHSGGGLFRRPE